MNKLAIAGIVVAVSAVAAAGDFYVDAVNGNDANDGRSAATARRTLAAAMAIDGLTAGDVVHAAPGTYDEGEMWDGNNSNRVIVAKGVGLVADGGQAETIIRGRLGTETTTGLGPDAVRCVRLSSDAWVRGFTITGGATRSTPVSNTNNGGGVYASGGAVVDCDITGNRCAYRGNGVYSGVTIRCHFHGNSGAGSYGTYYSDSFNCLFDGGDVSYGDRQIVNCVLNGGRTWSATSVSPVYNSYVLQDNGKMRYVNCLFSGAASALKDTSSYDPATCRFNVGNLGDSYDTATGRPLADSDGVDAGSKALYESAFPAKWLQFKDKGYAGGNRVSGREIDIGATELDQSSRIALDWYVDAVNGSDDNPGTSRKKAKRTLAAILSVEDLMTGDTVHAAPGTYDEGEMSDGANWNRAIVPAGVGLVADEGKSVTVIRGRLGTETATGLGSDAVRCVRLESGAWLQGFTVTNGSTRAVSDDNDDKGKGGGVYSNGTVVDCDILGNRCGGRGPGVNGGVVIRCRFRNNGMGRNIGSYAAYWYTRLIDCSLEGGDGCYSDGTVVNCRITGEARGTAPHPVYNSLVASDGGNKAYTNCIFGAKTVIKATSVVDEQTCSRDGDTVDAGCQALYDKAFPQSARRFKTRRDLEGNPRVSGAEIDIGPVELDQGDPHPDDPRPGSGRGFVLMIMGTPVSVASLRPVALVGSVAEVEAMQSNVTTPSRMVTETFTDGAGLPVADYRRYACVVILGSAAGFPSAARWDSWANREKVRKYLDGGGRIVLVESAAETLAAGSDWARDLAYSDAVIRTPILIGAYRHECSSSGRSLGEADADGNYVLTPEGERVARLEARYEDALSAGQNVLYDETPLDWGTEPLGAAGTLKHAAEFSSLPELRSAPVAYDDGPVLYDGDGTAAKIVYLNGTAAMVNLADEIKWHFERMTGAEFTTTKIRGTGVAVVLKTDTTMPSSTFSVSTDADSIVLAGRAPLNVGHAVTWLLERFGCRYLWPGETGKVVPRRTRLVAPQANFTFTCPLRYRQMRDYYNGNTDPALIVGKRGFFTWHGVSSGDKEMDGSYGWGHSFGDYYEKFHEAHPDWFAMQPNGSRDQNLAPYFERPEFCLSSRELVAHVAETLIPQYQANPNLKAASICLPDGGRATPCLCRACRSLDPVNGRATSLALGAPRYTTIGYVARTDRVLTFDNRIAEAVTAVCPDAKFCMYIYSHYVAPPAAVAPHPALVPLLVIGSYVTPASVANTRADLAAWCGFPNMKLWRPNLLGGYSAAAPINFARQAFDDLETLKANHVIGTDFDCMYGNWSEKGLVYYALAKAHLNVERLDYGAVFDDYCVTGFGAAAPKMKDYFALLERTLYESGQAGMQDYMRVLDLDALGDLLDEAAALASDDDEVLARIAFVRKCHPYARREKALAAAWDQRSNTAINAEKAAFAAFLSTIEEDPLVYRHADFQNSNRYQLHRYANFAR